MSKVYEVTVTNDDGQTTSINVTADTADAAKDVASEWQKSQTGFEQGTLSASEVKDAPPAEEAPAE
jgi:hypothetical protein